MPVVSLHNLGQSFGDFDVFLNLTASVHHNERVGLVGPNGIGKTTLLLLLSGHSKPSSGSISMAKGTRLGYLPQEAMDAFEDDARTVLDEMLTVFASLRGMEDRLREMEVAMETGDYSESLLRTYGELQEVFEKQGGYE